MQFAYQGAVPKPHILHCVEKYAVRVYDIHPDIHPVVSPSVPDFVETRSRDNKLFHRPAVYFPEMVHLVNILHGHAHHLARFLFLPVAGYADRFGLYVAELSDDILYYLPHQVVFERNLTLFFEVLFFGDGSAVGSFDFIVPLFAEGIVPAAASFLPKMFDVVPRSFGL